MTNFKRAVSIFLSVIMAFSMFSVLGTVASANTTLPVPNELENNAVNGYYHWEDPFDATKEYRVKSYAELAGYVNGEGYNYGGFTYGGSQGTFALESGANPWVYFGLEFYEVCPDGTTPDFTDLDGNNWVLTDHKVAPGDTLLYKLYIKSNVGLPSYIVDLQFDRNFFDIVPDQYKSGLGYDYAKDHYKNFGKTVVGTKDGLYNTGYPQGKVIGSAEWTVGKVSTTHDAIVNGKMENTITMGPAYMLVSPYNGSVKNLDPAPLLNTIRFEWDIARIIAAECDALYGVPNFSSDDYLVYNTVKVRTTEEPYMVGTENQGTVNYVSQGTVGHVGFEEGYTTFYKTQYRACVTKAAIGDGNTAGAAMNRANVVNSTTGCTVALPAMSYDTFHTEDMNHIFVIDVPGSGFNANFFETENGNEYTDLAMTGATTFNLPAAPTRPNYTFAGWSDGTTTYNAGAEVTISADTNFFAVWTASGYDVSFYDAQGGNEYTDLKLTNVNGSINLPAAQTKPGFRFDKWSDGTNEYEAGASVTISAATSFFATWKQLYTATFYDNNTAVGTAQQFAAGDSIDSITFPELAAQEGYTLSWSSSPEVTTVMPASDVVFTAVWTAGESAINFDAQGGDPVASITGSVGDPVNATLPVATRTGYTFDGWYVSTADDAAEFTLPAVFPASPVIAYAKWTANTYNATFKIQTGVDGNNEPIYEDYETVPTVFGETVVAPALPTTEGYTFSAWQAAPGYTAGMTMDSENKVFVSVRTANQYNITFYNKAGSYIDFSPARQAYGSVLQAPAAPVITGETFIGWRADDAGNTLIAAADIGTATVPARDTAYTAVYSSVQYNLSYYIDGITDPVHVDQYFYNAPITGYDYQAPQGYQFDGWRDLPNVMPEGNVSVHGSISPISYTVNYYKQEGDTTPYATFNCNYNDPVPEPDTDPTLPGKSFAGWDNIYTAVDDDIDIYGIWNDHSYSFTLTYGMYDTATHTLDPEATEEEGRAVTYGEQLTEEDFSTDAIIPGFSFVWKYNGETVTFPFTVPAFDDDGAVLEFKADYTINSYTLTYQINDIDNNTTDVDETVTLEYDAEITYKAAPSQTGYDYSDWALEGGGQLPARMPAGNLVVISEKNAHLYTDTWIDPYAPEGSQVVHTQQVAYGAAIPTVAIPTHEGYSNLRWTPQATTQEAADMTFTLRANASPADYKIEKYLQNVALDDYELIGTTTVGSSTGELVSLSQADQRETGFTFNTELSVTSGYVTGDGNFTLKAYFDRNSYVLTQVDNAGSNDTSIVYGASVPTLTAAEKEGHDFDKWTWSRTGGSTLSVAPTTMPAYAVTATASYTVKSYEFKVFVDGVQQGSTQMIKYGNALPSVATPTQTGYDFSGWKTDDTYATDFDFTQTMPAQNVSVYGRFTPHVYTYTFNDENGNLVDTIEAVYGADITNDIPEIPAKTGYDAISWTPAVGTTMGAADKTFTPIYQVQKFNVNFYVDGALYKQTKNVAYGTAVADIALPADPVKTGYTFTGWTGLPEVSMPANDVDVTAGFTVNSYDAVFYAVDGDAEAYTTISNVEFGTTFEVPECTVERDLYIFSGWTDGTNTYEAGATVTMDTEGKTFTGVWAQDTSQCRIESVEPTNNDPYYYQGLRKYTITLKEGFEAEVIKVTYVKDNNTVYNTGFSKLTFIYNDCEPGTAGVESIDMINGKEVWVVWMTLPEGNNRFTAYIENETEGIFETAESGYKFSVTYDDKAPSVIAQEFKSITIDGNAAVRGDVLTWTVDTSTNVEWLKFIGRYTSNGVDKELITYYKATNYKDATGEGVVTVSDNGDTRTWIIPMHFNYATNEDVIVETWQVDYKLDKESVWYTGHEGTEVTVGKTEALVNPSQTTYDPYTLVSATADGTATVGERKPITVVTTDDCTKIRITYKNAAGASKAATFQTTSKSNVSYADDGNGLRTWTINFKFAAPAADNEFVIETRGLEFGTENGTTTITVSVA